jgi:hypothetical protein
MTPTRRTWLSSLPSGVTKPWPDLAELVREQATKFAISPRQLELQVMLQIPRLRNSGRLTRKDTISTVEELASETSILIEPYRGLLEAPSDLEVNLRDANLEVVPEDEVRVILERFHYLRSFRPNSVGLGLRTSTSQRLIALLTLSDFDLDRLAEVLPGQINRSRLLVVSRVYAFDWAPNNTISRLLSLGGKWVSRARPDAEALLTYVNPNLGFTGASYRAANWIFFGKEMGTRYAYVSSRYITDRALLERFGTTDFTILQTTLGDRFEVSDTDLSPLDVYGVFLSKALKSEFSNDLNLVFQR